MATTAPPQSPLVEEPDWRAAARAIPYWLVRVPKAAGFVLLFGGLLVLFGWVVDLPLLEGLVAEMPKMVPVTAFCFACLGTALVLRDSHVYLRRRFPWTRVLPPILLGAAMTFSAWRLAIDLVHPALPFDANRFPLGPFLAPDALGGDVMAPASAFNFLVLGIALLLPRWRTFRLFQACALTALLVACISLGRYFYGGEPLLAFAQMSVPSTFLHLVAAFGVLCLRVESGLLSLLLAPGAGGLLLRRLLLPALLLAPLVGWLQLAGERAAFYGPEGGLTLYAYSNVILFCALVWWAALSLNRTDARREAAETSTLNQLERMSLLQQVTRATAERQDPASIYQVAVRSLENRLPVDFSGIFRFGDGGGWLEATFLGIKARELAPGLLDRAGAGPSLDAAGLEACLEGELIRSDHLESASAPFLRHLATLGLQSAVLAPLHAESQIFGLLVVGRAAPPPFSPGECEFLLQLAENVALAAFQAQLHGALEKAYNELRETRQSALERDRLRALGEMASGIAHDINNSISPASLHLETLLEVREGLPGGLRERLGIVQRAVLDVAQTVSRMQELYRRRATSNQARLQLNPLVEQVIELTSAKWRNTPLERGVVITVETALDPHLPPVQGNAGEIREALTNLVLNAVDAMPRGGRLRLATRTAPEEGSSPGRRLQRAVVEVSDSGIGMDEETRRRCLEPFFTTKGERGSGLGLPMVFGVAERHGGALEIDSELGAGTTVRLLFPATAETAEAPVALPAEDPSRGWRILVVDDDPTLLETLVDVFAGDGHQVEGAGGGAEAIEIFAGALARGTPFDLVVTDLGMPQVDGRQVAAGIKERSPETPVILLTGWGHRMISEGERPPNFDLVLSKPPRLKELRAALKGLR